MIIQPYLKKIISYILIMTSLLSFSSLECLAPESQLPGVQTFPLQKAKGVSSQSTSTYQPIIAINKNLLDSSFNSDSSPEDHHHHHDSFFHRTFESKTVLVILTIIALLVFSFAIVHDSLEEIINSGLFSTILYIKIISWITLIGLPSLTVFITIILPLMWKVTTQPLRFIHTIAKRAGNIQMDVLESDHYLNSSYCATILQIFIIISPIVAPISLGLFLIFFTIFLVETETSITDSFKNGAQAIHDIIKDSVSDLKFSGEDVETIAKNIAYIFLILTVALIHDIEFTIDMLFLLIFIYLVFSIIHTFIEKVSSNKNLVPKEFTDIIEKTPSTCFLHSIGEYQLSQKMEVSVSALEQFITKYNIDLNKQPIIVSFDITQNQTHSHYTPWIDGVVMNNPQSVSVSSFITNGFIQKTPLTKGYTFYGGSKISLKGTQDTEIVLRLTNNCGSSSLTGQHHQSISWDEEQYENQLSMTLRVVPILIYIALLILFMILAITLDRLHIYSIAVHSASFYLSAMGLLTALSIGICVTPFIFASGIIQIGYRQHLLGKKISTKNNTIFFSNPPQFFGLDINGTLIDHRTLKTIWFMSNNPFQKEELLARFCRAFNQTQVDANSAYMNQLVDLEPDNNTIESVRHSELISQDSIIYSHIQFENLTGDFYCGKLHHLQHLFPNLNTVQTTALNEDENKELWCLYDKQTEQCIALWNYRYDHCRQGLQEFLTTLKSEHIPVLLITGSTVIDLAIQTGRDKCLEHHDNVLLFYNCTHNEKAEILKVFKVHGHKIITFLKNDPKYQPQKGLTYQEFQEFLAKYNLTLSTEKPSKPKYRVAFMGDAPNDIPAFKQTDGWSFTEASTCDYRVRYNTAINLSSESLASIIPIFKVRRNYLRLLTIFLASVIIWMLISGLSLIFSGHHRILLSPIFHAVSECLLVIIFVSLIIMKCCYSIKDRKLSIKKSQNRQNRKGSDVIITKIDQSDMVLTNPSLTLLKQPSLSPEQKLLLQQSA